MSSTLEGRQLSQDVVFGITPPVPFYIAPFGIDYTLADSDTGASFPANSGEFTTEYNEATRLLFVPNAANGTATTTNAGSEVTFTFNTASTVYGVALFTSATKADGTDKLVDAYKFASPQTLQIGDPLIIQYQLECHPTA